MLSGTDDELTFERIAERARATVRLRRHHRAAFEVLRRYSSHTNIKLRDVAKRVADLKSLPADYTALTTTGIDPEDSGQVELVPEA